MLRWLLWILLLPVSLPLYGIRQLALTFRPFTRLDLRFSGALLDLPAGGGVFSEAETHLVPLLSALGAAERDRKLSQVTVRFSDFRPGLGRAEELRVALKRVRDAGKKVVVYAEEYSLGSYWVATAANEIVLAPGGALNVSGVASEFTLLKGLLSKLGVDAQLGARGKYKSMKEMFTEEHLTEANREMLGALVSDLFNQLRERISESRGLSPEAINQAFERAPFRADQAQIEKLVDRLAYVEDVDEELREAEKRRGAAGVRAVGLYPYLAAKRKRWFPQHRPKVALLRLSGNIKSGQSKPGPHGPRATGSEALVQAVQAAAKSKSVRAIVLRVDSPGGSALASDVMWRSLSKAKEKKPLFVSMANVAASGGYYVSGLKGVKIWASPSTLTGSIGVVAGKFAVAGLLSKLGIQRELVASGPRAAFYSPTQAWSEPELLKLSDDLDAHYHDFVSKMAEGRGVAYAELEARAQGRVWTGAQAKEQGLVDELGGLGAVLKAVRAELGVSDSAPLKLVDFTRQSLWQTLRARFPTGQALGGFGLATLPAASRLLELQADLEGESVFYLLPFEGTFF